MRQIARFFVMLLVLATASPSKASRYEPEVGQRHPDFTFPNIATGQPVSLADFRGKKVLLIHFSSW